MKTIYDKINRYHEGAFGSSPLRTSPTSWTPTITVSGGTAPQYSSINCTYARYGRLVKFSMILSGDGGAEGSGTNAILFTLPISANSSNGHIGSGYGVNSTTFINVLATYNSSTTMKLIIQSTGLDVTGANQNNATRSINVWGVYWSDA